MMDPLTLVYSAGPASLALAIRYYEREEGPPMDARKSYLVDIVAQKIGTLSHARKNSKRVRA
jgi:hypothetical protein